MPHTPKGLATVAFLKTRLDQGHDHLGLFEPIILDALLHLLTQDFVATDIQAIVHERTSLLLPANTIQTLLGRCARRGLLQRAGGRFFRTAKTIQDPDLDTARGPLQTEQAVLGRAFLEYAAAGGVQLGSPEEGLAALATFVSDNKVHLILEEPFPDSPLERSSLERKLTRLIARFVTKRCLESPEFRPALQALTEGIILADVLLLRDAPETAQCFRNLIVAFDSNVLFAAIDLRGVANGFAAKEGLTLLREAGARTVAFTKTLWEMRNILAVYERLLGTTEGRLSLYPTPLTQHVFNARLSPADIRVISSTLQNRLARVGVNICEIPPHDPRFTLGEPALARCLVDSKRPDVDASRIRHDVDCTAAVLTLRGGRTATSIERIGVIFCSSSGRVVRNVQQWFLSEGEKGVPPIVHLVALTSIAWLKKPAAAPDIKMHELAAVCVAAMRPTRNTWNKFVETLRNLRADGAITDDETAAIVVSELTEPVLARLDDDLEPDSDSIQEAIERVRESYRRETAAAAAEAVSKAQAETALAQRAASAAIARRDELVATIESRVSRLSQRIAKGLFAVGVIVTILAALLSLPGVFEAVGGVTKWAARAIIAGAAIFGAYSAIRGSSLSEFRASLEDRIAKRIRDRWFPGGEQLPAASGPQSR
jgi:hypothetical protein